jgi:hypothetical protein
MLNHRWIMLGAAALGVVLAATVGVRSWLDARDAQTRLAATVAAQKSVIDQAAAREAARAVELQQTLAEIAALKRRVATPQQVARELGKILPSLPQPIELHVPESAPGTPLDQAPPATATIPQLDLKPIFDAIEDCRACRAELDAARADLHDEHEKIAAVATQRDAALQTAKGGSFWKRVKRAGKWFVLGVGVGAALAASR